MKAITRREFGLFSAAGAVSLLSGTRSFAKEAPVAAVFDPTPYVHPELRPFVKAMLSFTPPTFTTDMLATARRNSFGLPPLAEPSWREKMIPGPTGAPAVRVFIVNGTPGAALRPAILHIHGGGFIIGDAKSALGTVQDLAKSLDCVVVTVDYRLAPETRFPGSLEDNYAALKWLYQHAAEIGVDPSRIAVMGESAGGGHAAMLAIAARDRGEVPLVYQALIYPMLDDRTGTKPVPPYKGALIWTPASNRFGWASLLGVPAGSRRVPYGSVPARVEDLRGLPPAFIGVGSIDLFVDEDIAYARRLIGAGVPTELNVVPGAFHGFDVVGRNTAVGREFKSDLMNGLRRALGREQ